MSDGAQQIAAERGRQIVTEGYSVEQDLHQGVPVLLAAAESYVRSAQGREAGFLEKSTRAFGAERWPFADALFKPMTTKRDLVKAGALIAAAIDLVDVQERAARPLDDRGFDFAGTTTPDDEEHA